MSKPLSTNAEMGRLHKLRAARERSNCLPTGDAPLDEAIGGGIPYGSIVEIYGDAGIGKTTLALEIIAQYQRSRAAMAALFDADHAFDAGAAQALGIRGDALLLAQPQTGEQAFDMAITLLRAGAVRLVVFDSAAAMLPRAQDGLPMHTAPEDAQTDMMAQMLRRLSRVVLQQGAIAIFTNHERVRQTYFGAQYRTSVGGRALKLHSDIRLNLYGDGQEHARRIDIVRNIYSPRAYGIAYTSHQS